MSRKRAQSLFAKFAPAMAYIVIENSDGSEGIGSAFHVGSGVFVTARHVVENNLVKKVHVSEPLALSTAEKFNGEIPNDYDVEIEKSFSADVFADSAKRPGGSGHPSAYNAKDPARENRVCVITDGGDYAHSFGRW